MAGAHRAAGSPWVVSWHENEEQAGLGKGKGDIEGITRGRDDMRGLAHQWIGESLAEGNGNVQSGQASRPGTSLEAAIGVFPAPVQPNSDNCPRLPSIGESGESTASLLACPPELSSTADVSTDAAESSVGCWARETLFSSILDVSGNGGVQGGSCPGTSEPLVEGAEAP